MKTGTLKDWLVRGRLDLLKPPHRGLLGPSHIPDCSSLLLDAQHCEIDIFGFVCVRVVPWLALQVNIFRTRLAVSTTFTLSASLGQPQAGYSSLLQLTYSQNSRAAT